MSPRPAEGARLGPYELIARIGRGGMGDVWRAVDPRLGREVAIKLSREQFTDRFEREARAIAALNHPNICTLFDVGPTYLVMELIEGPTLADRIAEGPIPLEESLAIAKQIADALEAAHEKNIVHRDLKPGNIKIRSDGSVKVLDFGLAKASMPESVITHDSPTMPLNSPTLVGVILGTAAYMAPEQARGKSVDKRADIWSFGVVLYEMITGVRAFEGEDLTDTVASVVKSDPNLAPVPPKLRRLISKCLQKDPKERLRDIGDAWELLSDAAIDLTPITAPLQSPKRTSMLWAAAAAVMALAAAAVSFLHFREKPAPAPSAMRFQIRLPQGVKFESGGSFAVSPDGKHAAFPAINAQGAAHWFVQDLDGGSARELSNTKISTATPPSWWSPDSAFLAYSGGPTVDKVEVATGFTQAICDKPGPAVGGSWDRDGIVIFGSLNSGLWRVPASGGKAVPLTRLDESRKETSHQLPSFLPDGRHYIFLATSADPSKSGIFARSLDDAPDKPSVLLVSSEYGGAFVPDAGGSGGWLLYLHGSPVAQRLLADRLQLTGDPVALPASIGTAYSTALFSVSPDVLVYRSGGAKRVVQFEWINAKSGESGGNVGEPGVIDDPSMSPDEKHVAYTRETDGIQDIWILDVERGASNRLTLGGTNHRDPVWSPDGSQVIYSESVDGGWRLVRKRVDGIGGEEPVLSLPRQSLRPDDWSPDGRYLLLEKSNTPGFVSSSLYVLPIGPGSGAKSAAPVAVTSTAFDEGWAAFSPDGHYVAYASTETGRWEVYVRTFEQNPGGQPPGKWIVSKNGGRQPMWTRDGKKLVWSHNSAAWDAPVDLSQGFHTGSPELLYPMQDAVGAATFLTAKGRGLVLNPVSPLADEPINVIVNWKSALRTAAAN